MCLHHKGSHEQEDREVEYQGATGTGAESPLLLAPPQAAGYPAAFKEAITLCLSECSMLEGMQSKGPPLHTSVVDDDEHLPAHGPWMDGILPRLRADRLRQHFWLSHLRKRESSCTRTGKALGGPDIGCGRNRPANDRKGLWPQTSASHSRPRV